jgi:predicted enzyme related to lactoylglutathione lyase
MAKVIGFGGVFFKSRDPKALAEWYAKHLGVNIENFGGVMYAEDEKRPGFTLWMPFADSTKHFEPSQREFMLNFRVDDLAALLRQLRSAGVQVEARTEDSEYGRFGWIADPDGTRIELWEPPAA